MEKEIIPKLHNDIDELLELNVTLRKNFICGKRNEKGT